ncbi:MAG: TolC family protein [Vicinamibacterales bacterium]
MNRLLLLLVTVAGLGLLATSAAAQTPGIGAASPRTFTLQDALQYAVEHYPSVKAAIEEVNASSADVRVAKAAALPRLDGVWQTNRATVNNVTGLLLPQSIVPGISGPPLPDGSAQSAWGTAAGAFFSWEPFDLGLRAADVRSAEAAVTRARASEGLTRLEVQASVAGAFLAVVHAELAITAAQADLDRRTVLARAARALADNQLRPGADASRADAELAAARTRSILAHKDLVVAQASLGRFLGVPEGLAGANAAALLTSTAPPAGPASEAPTSSEAPRSSETPASSDASASHPLLQVRQAAVTAARAHDEVLADTNRPRLFLQSALFARGSGATFNGTLEGGTSGLWFDRANWAAGFQVVFPNLFEIPSLRARRAASAATVRAEAARYDEAQLLVTSEQRAARAITDAARAVAANTPVQLAAARESEARASARYQAGLASIVEVADAQSLLAQAEYQDAVARVDIWRALVGEAAARGDLAPLRTLAASSAGGTR